MRKHPGKVLVVDERGTAWILLGWQELENVIAFEDGGVAAAPHEFGWGIFLGCVSCGVFGDMCDRRDDER